MSVRFVLPSSHSAERLRGILSMTESEIDNEKIADTSVEKEVEAPLSKNAQKKLARAKRLEENLESFKNFKRQKRRERREKRRTLNIPHVRPTTRLMSDNAASKTRIVVHCGYSELMDEKTNKNLVRQLVETYGVNRRSEHPAQLYFTAINDVYKKYFFEYCPNYASWDVNMDQRSYLDVFDKKDIIYLTSESPNKLQKIDETKVYIIGGLIDRNSRKGLTLKEADEHSLQHQSLPISQYLRMRKGSVLTTNQVFEILTSMICNGNDIQMALEKAVPKRNIMEKKCDKSDTDC